MGCSEPGYQSFGATNNLVSRSDRDWTLHPRLVQPDSCRQGFLCHTARGSTRVANIVMWGR
ncbi:hypothetical protein IG631_22892 [Alternaria alternata]|nr:hypothetical protein IG631_22892 [Alternaria alternata]